MSEIIEQMDKAGKADGLEGKLEYIQQHFYDTVWVEAGMPLQSVALFDATSGKDKKLRNQAFPLNYGRLTTLEALKTLKRLFLAGVCSLSLVSLGLTIIG